MSWRRLPTALPNIALKLYPLSKAQQTLYETTGRVTELVFRTSPATNKASGRVVARRRTCRSSRRCMEKDGGKVARPCRAGSPSPGQSPGRDQLSPTHASTVWQAEIKEVIEKLYGLSVDKVNTCNYLGRKKHGRAGFYRCSLAFVCERG